MDQRLEMNYAKSHFYITNYFLALNRRVHNRGTNLFNYLSVPIFVDAPKSFFFSFNI